VCAFFFPHDLQTCQEQIIMTESIGCHTLCFKPYILSTWDNFQSYLMKIRKINTQVVHLAGHHEKRGFCFTDRVMDEESLITLLAEQKDHIDCVVLNACSTRSVGLRLRERGVKNVVCWQGTVKDPVAVKFTDMFYKSLKLAAEGQRRMPDKAFRAAFVQAEINIRQELSSSTPSASRGPVPPLPADPQENVVVFLSEDDERFGAGNSSDSGSSKAETVKVEAGTPTTTGAGAGTSTPPRTDSPAASETPRTRKRGTSTPPTVDKRAAINSKQLEGHSGPRPTPAATTGKDSVVDTGNHLGFHRISASKQLEAAEAGPDSTDTTDASAGPARKASKRTRTERQGGEGSSGAAGPQGGHASGALQVGRQCGPGAQAGGPRPRADIAAGKGKGKRSEDNLNTEGTGTDTPENLKEKRGRVGIGRFLGFHKLPP